MNIAMLNEGTVARQQGIEWNGDSEEPKERPQSGPQHKGAHLQFQHPRTERGLDHAVRQIQSLQNHGHAFGLVIGQLRFENNCVAFSTSVST